MNAKAFIGAYLVTTGIINIFTQIDLLDFIVNITIGIGIYLVLDSYNSLHNNKYKEV